MDNCNESNPAVFRNPVVTDDRLKNSLSSRGVVSFDTSQLDSPEQPHRNDDNYKNSASPLHQTFTRGIGSLPGVYNEFQEVPNQYWKRGNNRGTYQTRANVKSYSNHHSYPPPSYGIDNELGNPAPHWRRRLNTTANGEHPINRDYSFSSSEQYYHGGYRIYPESYHNCNHYQSCGPQYHSFYHHRPYDSNPTRAQHHTAQSSSLQQSPHREMTSHKSNGVYLRPITMDTHGRETDIRGYPLKSHHYSPTPNRHQHYSCSPPKFPPRDFTTPNHDYFTKRPVGVSWPENFLMEAHGSMSRKRKFLDTSCAEENKNEYMIYTDRCMSPVSDISVSSAASQDLDDKFHNNFQTPINEGHLQQSVIGMTSRERQISSSKHDIQPKDYESIYVPRIERGEKYYPFFNFDSNIQPVRAVTPMKMNTYTIPEGGMKKHSRHV